MYERVLLIEMEGPRGQPTLCSEMQIPFFGGLREILRGAATLEDSLWQTDTKNLWLLPFGASSYEINGLDATARTRELLASVRTMFDVVIVDMPPVLLDEQAPAIVSHLSGLIFVVESGATTAEDFSKTVSLCEPVPVKGVLLNKTNLATPNWLASLLGF
jgi:Mrp family chromosome partitioning ATPase